MPTYYELQIYGATWEGFNSLYVYRLAAPITTDDEAKREAGDFSRVYDWRLVEITTTRTGTRCSTTTKVTRKTLRGFHNTSMTPARFERRLHGAG